MNFFEKFFLYFAAKIYSNLATKKSHLFITLSVTSCDSIFSSKNHKCVENVDRNYDKISVFGINEQIWNYFSWYIKKLCLFKIGARKLVK